MIRNGGKIIKDLNLTTSSGTTGAKGVYDTFDAYNARLGNLWPITPYYSANVSVSSTTMFEKGTLTVTNFSKDLEANTTLYSTIERISGPLDIGNYVGLSNAGSFSQPAGLTGSASITLIPPFNYYEPNTNREPIQFRVNIRTGSITGPIINNSPVITMPVPIATLEFLPYFDRGPSANFDETQFAYYLRLTWSNVGTYYSVPEIFYGITYSGTATAQDLINPPTGMSNGTDTIFYDAQSSYIYGKKDYLTEGLETLNITVTSTTYGNTLGTVSPNIVDTSTSPVTTITPAATSVEKGNTIRFDVAIENAQETNIYYVVTGSAASKFSPQSGSFVLSAGGITLTALNNFNYSEADTTFQVQFRAQSTSGYLYGTTPVITVTNPPQPSATIVPIASVDEGSTNSFVVNTTNYSGTLNWELNQLVDSQTALTSTILLTAQSPTIVDNSSYNSTITRSSINSSGVVAIEASKVGVPTPSYSNTFGDGSWITVTNSTAFDFGTGDWTVETWINPSSTNGFIYSHRNEDNFAPLIIGIASSKLQLIASVGSWFNIFSTGTTIIPQGLWTHIAVVRNGSTIKTYINGSQDLSFSGFTGAMMQTTDNIAIGAGGASNGNNQYSGKISNLRVVKGTALYTSAFTPSKTPLTQISGTSLLTCLYSTISASGNTGLGIVEVGYVTVQATSNSDFVIGASNYYYFNTSQNYLSINNNSLFDLGSQNWTFETWAYVTSTEFCTIFSKGTYQNSPIMISTTNSSLKVQGVLESGAFYSANGTNNTIPIKTWTHIAVVREGTTIRGYVNGNLDITISNINGNLAYTTRPVTIGIADTIYPYYGYLSNLRLVKGATLYNNSFTPALLAEVLPTTTSTFGLAETIPTLTDFFNANTGTVTVANGGSSTITVKPRQDTFTEGAETFRITVKLTSGTVLNSTNFIINDTSTGTAEVKDLYSFSYLKFLSGNDDVNFRYGNDYATQTGNSLATLLSIYINDKNYSWLTNTSYYNVVTAGIQQWTVPFTGVYRFKVAGAKGGGWWAGSANNGGLGAILSGEVFLTRGTVVNIVVGKTGASSGDSVTGGGGGGGTFVYTGAIGGTGLLFAAGGGGGADDDSLTGGQTAREDLCAGFNAAAVRANPTDGLGAANAGAGGGSGCGWLSDGQGSGAGLRFTGGSSVGNGGSGGFGGGGGDLDDGGAGGGYTGGTSSSVAGGGCGGSYYNPQLVNNYAWAGYNNSTIGNGFVEVTAIATGTTAVITPSSSTITEGQSVTFNIVTTGFVSGTLYYNLLTNTGSISSSEFTNTSSFTGSVTIADSVGQVTYTYRSDGYTEGTEAISLLVYYNSGGIKYTVGTSSQVTISDTSAGSAAQFGSYSNIIQYIGTYTNYEVTTSASGLLNVGSRGWTILRDTTTATADSYFSVPLPFSFKINNTNFTNVLINENAWMVFGTVGSALSAGFVSTTAASAVPYNKLVFSGGNNSMQRLFYRVEAENRFVLIRYEGNASTSGTQGSPGIIAEIKLLNPLFTGGISMIELKYQTNRTVSSTSHKPSLSSPSAYYTYYDHPFTNTYYSIVFYALNAEATTWTNTTTGYSAVL